MIGAAWRPFTETWQVESRTGNLLRRYMCGAEPYDVAISLPADRPDAGLPVLVVTDGSLHFDAVAAAATALARRPAKTGVGPMIVAGIASGVDWTHDPERRARDLACCDGGGRLLALLRDRLLPDIRRLAPAVETAVSLFGHSFGGLFVLNALSDETSPFTAGVAVSPSVWRAPKHVQRALTRAAEMDRRLLIVSGEREPMLNPQLAAATMHVQETSGFDRTLLKGEDHGSAALAAIPLALRFLQSPRSPATRTER